MNPPARTNAHRTSAQPSDGYSGLSHAAVAPSPNTVVFSGLDGRQRTFKTSDWPLASLHTDLCTAFRRLTAATGTVRTESSAASVWSTVRRFVFFLATLDRPPSSAAAIGATHVRAFIDHRAALTSSSNGEIRNLNGFLKVMLGPADQNPNLQRILSQRRPKTVESIGVEGYDPMTFQSIVSAARSDVVRIRDRIKHGRSVATSSADLMHGRELELQAALASSLEHGTVRTPPDTSRHQSAMRQMARQVFLTYEDLTPLLILLACLSGRNSETLKELPAQHVLMADSAVRVVATKRRRKSHWTEPIHWQIRRDHRQLHTAGGLYLLIHELCEPSRSFADSDMLWAVWTNGNKNGKDVSNGHMFPWKTSLGAAPLHFNRWAASHSLTTDGAPLPISLGRIRTTVLQMETQAAGGHLPSSTKGNTQDVLYRNYLSGDPTVKDWASNIMQETFDDIQNEIRMHRDGSLLGRGIPLANGQDTDAVQRAHLACSDERDPATEHPCRQSVLACFACPNAVVSRRNLPGLLNLRNELLRRRQEVPSPLWWRRFGTAWVALNEDILPRFTPAELESAEATHEAFLPLSLLEDSL